MSRYGKHAVSEFSAVLTTAAARTMKQSSVYSIDMYSIFRRRRLSASSVVYCIAMFLDLRVVTAFGDPAGATDDVILDTNGQSGECSRLVCNPVDKYAVTAVKIWIQTGRCFLSYSGKRVGQRYTRVCRS